MNCLFYLDCGKESTSQDNKHEGYRCPECSYRIVYKKRTPKSK